MKGRIDMGKFKDLTGQKFGRWTVIKRGEDKIDQNGRHRTSWICKCECGNIKNVVSQALTNGDSKSCGCLQLEMTRLATEKDLTGQHFGRLTVIEKYAHAKRSTYKCLCDCGNIINVLGSSLVTGRTQSCGCLRNERMKKATYKDLTGNRFGKLTVIKECGHKNNSIAWLCQCDCGNQIIVSGHSLKCGYTSSCGCLCSKGEYSVIQWLQMHNIEFEFQKKFPELIGVNNGKLSYDFYLPQYNLLTEIQGIQHEKPIEIFGGEEQFKTQQEHDRRKREYAEKNGYKLLEIWYYDYDRIEEILNRELEVV